MAQRYRRIYRHRWQYFPLLPPHQVAYIMFIIAQQQYIQLTCVICFFSVHQLCFTQHICHVLPTRKIYAARFHIKITCRTATTPCTVLTIHTTSRAATVRATSCLAERTLSSWRGVRRLLHGATMHPVANDVTRRRSAIINHHLWCYEYNIDTLIWLIWLIESLNNTERWFCVFKNINKPSRVQPSCTLCGVHLRPLGNIVVERRTD